MTLWWYFMSFHFKSRCHIESLFTGHTLESCSLSDSKLWYFMSCNFNSRCQIESLFTGHTHESCSLSDSKLLCKMTLLWYFMTYFMTWSPDVKLNLLPQSSKWNPVCSLIQSYNQIEPSATVLIMKSCLLFDSKLQPNWTFCHSLHNAVIIALWFKTTLQNGFVVIIQVLWLISSPDDKLNLLS